MTTDSDEGTLPCTSDDVRPGEAFLSLDPSNRSLPVLPATPGDQSQVVVNRLGTKVSGTTQEPEPSRPENTATLLVAHPSESGSLWSRLCGPLRDVTPAAVGGREIENRVVSEDVRGLLPKEVRGRCR